MRAIILRNSIFRSITLIRNTLKSLARQIETQTLCLRLQKAVATNGVSFVKVGETVQKSSSSLSTVSSLSKLFNHSSGISSHIKNEFSRKKRSELSEMMTRI